MDREEVTKWLTIIKANLNSFPEVSSEKKIEALAEAIRLLKNEQSKEPRGSTTKNDLGVDCIDRKEFIDWINVWDITPIIKRPLIRHVQGMSSVTPVIHAKWDKGYTFPDGAYWKCTNCGELIKVKVPMHYCSNCGAKMDGGEKPSLQR